MSELSIEQVSVKLGADSVVRDIEASLTPGRLYVLAGPNGAGKSTLLRAMAALLPLESGVVTLDGRDVRNMTPAARAAQIAYLPQDRGIAWDLSCVDIAALGAQHLEPELARQRAFAELQALGLHEVCDRGVFGLSGGQRARVLLARVLCSPAGILLLDEPLIALDPAWQRQVLMRLKQRAAEGQTIVLSLHDLHLAAQFADTILLMHKGELTATGTPDQVFTPENLRDVFSLSGELNGPPEARVLTLSSQPLLCERS